MKNIISIIVPVYNVEQYIEQCIESIISQSYKDLEIILIDDGSTDQSGIICDKYAQMDKRIKVIHQNNGGAASAKNAGLRVASGEYLAFVDSDDYLEPDCYKYMIETIEVYNADVIQCSFKNIYVGSEEMHLNTEEIKVFQTEEYLERYTTHWTSGLLWDKLYKRYLFDNVFFEEGHKIDDEFFTYQGIMNANKIICSPRIIYNYRKRKSSVMMSLESQRQILLDKIDYLTKRRKKIVKRFPQLKVLFDNHFLNMLLIISRDFNADCDVIKLVKEQITAYFAEKNNIKIKFRFWLQLKNLQNQNMETLLQKKCKDLSISDSSNYFE